ncbi:hypothetical protein ACHAWF_016261 [Thalassiosira exigua]
MATGKHDSGTRPPLLLSKSYRGVTLYGAIDLNDDEETGDSPLEAVRRVTIDRRSQFRSIVTVSTDQGGFSFRKSVRSLSHKSFRLSGKPCSVRALGGTATVPTQTFNLSKNIIGAGVLALPSGIAAFANAPSALIPVAFLTVVTGAIFGYYFHLIGRVCQITMTATFREAWENTVGETGSTLVAIIIVLKAALGNLAYSMILADTLRSILQWIGLHLSRSTVLVGLTIVVLLPLCLLKNLQVLGPFSLVGLGGMLFTGLAMTVRYYDGSYDVEQNGRFLSDIEEDLKPSFGNTGAGGALSPTFLVLAVMLFEAFVAHYNAPRFYVELKNNTVQRFGLVTAYSFGISVAFFMLVSTFGFLTFGQNCSGFILNNYSPKDILATISRVAIFVAVATTYPLVFLGTKDGILDLLMVPMELQTSQNLNVLTVILLTIITLIAMFVTDLGLVAAVGGATLATAVVFIFPALMLRSAVYDLGSKATSEQKIEVTLCLVLMSVGIMMGIIGFWLAVTG